MDKLNTLKDLLIWKGKLFTETLEYVDVYLHFFSGFKLVCTKIDFIFIFFNNFI